MNPSVPWFRLYSDLLNNHKVQTLSDKLFRAYLNTLCIASNHDPRGQLPDLERYAFSLRCTEKQAEKIRNSLLSAGLLEKISEHSDQNSEKFCPNSEKFCIHNWSKRQFDSDASYERVQRHRSKMKRFSNVSSAVTETAPETDTEEEQNRRDEKGTGSLAASLDSFFEITEERWQKAIEKGFVNRAWVEQETGKFNLKGKSFAAKYPNIENAWLMWLYRGKEYADKHPNVVPIKPAEPPRRRHLFGER